MQTYSLKQTKSAWWYMRNASLLTKLPPPPSRAHIASHVVSTVHMQGKQLAVQ